MKMLSPYNQRETDSMLTTNKEMHSAPLVSVVLPTFNRAGLLPRAMTTVLSQDYSNLELIVVDDGSTDNTPGIVAGLTDERVKYCRLEQQRGAALARNAGIGIAQGSLIAFQDSDDEWLPGKLSQQVRAIGARGDSLGFAYTSFWRERNGFRERVPSSSQVLRRASEFDRLLRGNYIGMPTLIVTRSCLEATGEFDETMHSLEDWDLMLRLARVAEGAFIDEPLVIVHESPSGVNSQGAGVMLRSLESIRRRYGSDFRRDKRADSEMYLAMAATSCRGTGLKSWHASVFQFARACIRDPSNTKAWVLLAASLTGPKSVIRLQDLRHRFASGGIDST